MNSRVEYLDIAKGIGILLVYIGHSSLDENEPLFQSIYSFHMPLFFMISGLLFSYKRNIGIRKTILGKIVSLLVPYFLFSLIYGLFYLMVGTNPLVYLWDGWGRVPLWFIPVLFLIEVFHLLLLEGKNIYKVVVVVILSVLFTYKIRVNGWLPYCVSEIPWFYLCFITGYLLNKFGCSKVAAIHGRDICEAHKLKYLVGGALLFVVGQIILYKIVIPYNMNYRLQDNDFLSYIMRYALGVIGAISTLFLSEGLIHSRIGDLLKWFGINSLVILCVHYLPLKFLCPRLLFPVNHIMVWFLIVLSIILYNKFVSTYITYLKKKVYDTPNNSLLLVK